MRNAASHCLPGGDRRPLIEQAESCPWVLGGLAASPLTAAVRARPDNPGHAVTGHLALYTKLLGHLGHEDLLPGRHEAGRPS
ncbi:MAG: hypothetical protein M3Q65_13310 [Chloroflexota bacterium]|nr:hypothetical protein [Chloroflexota bacterium]